MTVKRKVSSAQTGSTSTGGYGSSDAQNTSTCNTEGFEFLTEFFSTVLGHLNNLLQNQTR